MIFLVTDVIFLNLAIFLINLIFWNFVKSLIFVYKAKFLMFLVILILLPVLSTILFLFIVAKT